jgi:hypothetical protein
MEGQSKKYSRVSFAIPLVMGIKYRFAPKWTLFGELGYRFTFTDYLDDVGGYYYNFGNDSHLSAIYGDRSPEAGYPANVPGSQRGDLAKNDTYMFGVIGISFSFVSSHCRIW